MIPPPEQARPRLRLGRLGPGARTAGPAPPSPGPSAADRRAARLQRVAGPGTDLSHGHPRANSGRRRPVHRAGFGRPAAAGNFRTRGGSERPGRLHRHRRCAHRPALRDDPDRPRTCSPPRGRRGGASCWCTARATNPAGYPGIPTIPGSSSRSTSRGRQFPRGVRARRRCDGGGGARGGDRDRPARSCGGHAHRLRDGGRGRPGEFGTHRVLPGSDQRARQLSGGPLHRTGAGRGRPIPPRLQPGPQPLLRLFHHLPLPRPLAGEPD